MQNEPVLTVDGIVAAIMGLATFAIAGGWLAWDNATLGAFQAMLVAIVPIVVIMIGAWIKRSRVMPMVKVERIKSGEIIE